MIVVAISGASGVILGIRLIEELIKLKEDVAAIVSDSAKRVIELEVLPKGAAYTTLVDLLQKRENRGSPEHLVEIQNDDFLSSIASGSNDFEAAVVSPCSMKTLSAIVHGYAETLMVRVCDIALKEKRRCILQPRETPFNLIHIENMRKAILAGCEILPPIPGFYTHPQCVDDIVDFITGKTLSLLGRNHQLFQPWNKPIDYTDGT